MTEDVDVDHHLIVQCQEADLDPKVLQGGDVGEVVELPRQDVGRDDEKKVIDEWTWTGSFFKTSICVEKGPHCSWGVFLGGALAGIWRSSRVFIEQTTGQAQHICFSHHCIGSIPLNSDPFLRKMLHARILKSICFDGTNLQYIM